MLLTKTDGVVQLLALMRETGDKRLRRRELGSSRLIRWELSGFRVQSMTQLQVVRYGSKIQTTEGARQSEFGSPS